MEMFDKMKMFKCPNCGFKTMTPRGCMVCGEPFDDNPDVDPEEHLGIEVHNPPQKKN